MDEYQVDVFVWKRMEGIKVMTPRELEDRGY